MTWLAESTADKCEESTFEVSWNILGGEAY